MNEEYEGLTLPEIKVTAPKLYSQGYDDNGNPIYTTDYSKSDKGITERLIKEGKYYTKKETDRKKAKQEIARRRPGLTNPYVKPIRDFAIGSIGGALGVTTLGTQVLPSLANMGKAAVADAITHPIATSVGIGTGIAGDNVDRHYNLTGKLLESINDKTTFNFNTKNPTFTLGGLVGGLGGDLAARVSIEPWARNQIKTYLLNRNLNNQIKNTSLSSIDPLKQDQVTLVHSQNPNPISTNKASLKLLERPKANITDAELKGIPKIDRNQPLKSNPLAGSNSNVDTYLINKGDNYFQFVDGKLVFKPGNAKSGIQRKTVHFTTDQPVIDHAQGNWSGASETLLTPYQQIVKDNGIPMNIDPMDTWFSNQYPFIIRQNGSKIFTSNPKNYYKYKSQGIDVETSKEAQKLYQQLQDAFKQEKNLNEAWKKVDYELYSPEYNALNKYRQTVTRPLLDQHDRIHRNWVKQNNNKPTINTYKQLEQETGLDSGVTEYRGKMDYWDTPASHSSMWYFDELNDGQRFNQFLRQVIEYPKAITAQDYQLFEQLVRKNPNLVKEFLNPTDDLSQIKNPDILNKLPKEIQQILHNIQTRGYKQGGNII